jgi:ABC-type arginine transport system ATPase subunit
VTPILFAHAWFTTAFGYTFPVDFTAQVWTVFFVSGKVFLFRVAVAILKLMEPMLLKLDFDESLAALKNSVNLNVFRVIEEADRFSAIENKVVKKLKQEALKVLKSSNLSDLM